MQDPNSLGLLSTIEKMNDSLNNKYQNALMFVSTEPKFTKFLIPPIELTHDRTYKAAVKSFAVYNSIRNVRKNVNDIFCYSSDNGSTWKKLVLYPGSYNASDIVQEIYRHDRYSSQCKS